MDATRTLVFTDVVDSTRLVERLGDAVAALMWAEHDRRARALMNARRGVEIDRTDGFFVLFEAATDAVAFALGYHAEIAALDLRARAGVHTGVVLLRANAAEDVARGAKPVEVDGLAKPLAARVMALASAGQTLLSAGAFEVLASSPEEGWRIEAHGHYRLKGIDEPQSLFEVGNVDAAFVPPPDTDKAYRVVRAGDLWLPLRDVPNNLPRERDAFVGRVDKLRLLAQRYDQGARLLSLLGPGGTGKTRVAIRYGRAWLGDWPGGVYFCDLTEARTPEGICHAAALALGIPLGKDDLIAQVGHAIAGRGRCLVLLDNFEQVAVQAAATLGRWVDRASDAAFLVTSRERLGLPGEEVIEVDPLPLAREAIELFEVRVRALQSGFVVDAVNRADVMRVVALLDGLPLAIELAAARMRVMSLPQLAERLQDRFHVLAGMRGVAARQATLKAAIDWSWDLLDPVEQRALAQCSVFEGGFTLDAAEGTLDLGADAPPVLDVVQALVDKSLLRAVAPSGGARLNIDEPYFAMYLSIREYAAVRLDAVGGAVAAQRSHGAWFARMGDDAAIDALYRQGGESRRVALALDIENLVAACRRAVPRGDAAIAVPAFVGAAEVFDVQGPATAGVLLGTSVVAMPGMSDRQRAAASATMGRMTFRAGHVEEAARWYGDAVDLARRAGDERQELAAAVERAFLWGRQGRHEEALVVYAELLPRIRRHGDAVLLGAALGNLAVTNYERNLIDDATACCLEAAMLQRKLGNKRSEAMALKALGTVHTERGRIDEAVELLEQAASLFRGIGDRVNLVSAIAILGWLRTRQGRHVEAQQLLETALTDCRELGLRYTEGQVLSSLGVVHQSLGELTLTRRRYLQALEIHRETGNANFEAVCIGQLGSLAHSEGRLDEAERHLRESIRLFLRIGNRGHEAQASRELAAVLLDAGGLDEAAALLDHADTELGELGLELHLAITRCVRGRLLVARGEPKLARSLLAHAEAFALAHDLDTASELCGEIERLRSVLVEVGGLS